MGEGLTELSILHAPVVNLLIWTDLICLAGLSPGSALDGANSPHATSPTSKASASPA